MEQHELDDLAILTGDGRIFSPKSDFVFKYIFSDEDIVIGFLQAVLDIPPEEYAKIEFSNTFLNKRRRDGKYSILDLVITTKSGHKIDVEIQRAKLNDFGKRAAYYVSRLAGDQLDANERYENLRRSIVIFILDHKFFDDDECFNSFRLRTKSGKELTEALEVNILELPKVPKNHSDNPLYDWADFFNAKTVDDLNKINKSRPIHRAVFGLKKLCADEDFKMEYECWLKNEREKNSYESTGFSKGKAEGMAEGMAKGIAKGMAKGMAKGKAEGVAEGMAKGKIEGKIKAVINLIQETNWPLEKAMQILKIDDAYKYEIEAQLKKMHGND